jgi:hypothetical protein
MRYLLLSTPLLVVLALAGPAGAETDEPTTNPEASKAFVAMPSPTMTAETVIPQIVEAGREQLAAACVVNPGASVRINNPLASGDHVDVPCSTILDDGESVGRASEALATGGEHLGQTQQKGVITTVACFAAGAALFAGTRYGVCEYGGGPGAEGDRRRAACNDVGGWGSLGLGFFCTLTAVIPF